MALEWIKQFLLPCPFKAITGLDCPGCGLQRSFIELLSGNFSKSFAVYPPLLPILFLFVFLLLHLKFKFRNGAVILQYAFLATVVIIVTSFVVKTAHFHS